MGPFEICNKTICKNVGACTLLKCNKKNKYTNISMGNAMVKISRGRVHFEDWEGFGLLDPLIGMLPFLNTYG